MSDEDIARRLGEDVERAVRAALSEERQRLAKREARVERRLDAVEKELERLRLAANLAERKADEVSSDEERARARGKVEVMRCVLDAIQAVL